VAPPPAPWPAAEFGSITHVAQPGSGAQFIRARGVPGEPFPAALKAPAR
jgi:hypothetical protein